MAVACTTSWASMTVDVVLSVRVSFAGSSSAGMPSHSHSATRSHTRGHETINAVLSLTRSKRRTEERRVFPVNRYTNS
ncbi:hypothetical protein K439DRAFT_1639936 [Ramaria rubella]|nr:hypothetical protein K439DRAFT_1639936 [Ramaria rubella]